MPIQGPNQIGVKISFKGRIKRSARSTSSSPPPGTRRMSGLRRSRSLYPGVRLRADGRASRLASVRTQNRDASPFPIARGLRGHGARHHGIGIAPDLRVPKHVRQDQGTAHRVRAKGRLLGRPKGVLGKSRLDGKEEEIRLLLQKQVSKASIAKIVGVTRPNIHRFIKTRRLRPHP